MIKFEVSAPSKLSLFGEHAVTHGKTGLTAAMNIRTTLTFYELPFSSNSCLQLHIPRLYLHSTPLQDFLMVYNNCVKDMKLLREKVLEFTRKTIGYTHNSSHWSTFIDTFYYLLIYIVSSIWAAMARQNKPPPCGHWRQRRGLDVGVERSDWWRG